MKQKIINSYQKHKNIGKKEASPTQISITKNRTKVSKLAIHKWDQNRKIHWEFLTHKQKYTKMNFRNLTLCWNIWTSFISSKLHLRKSLALLPPKYSLKLQISNSSFKFNQIAIKTKPFSRKLITIILPKKNKSINKEWSKQNWIGN